MWNIFICSTCLTLSLRWVPSIQQNEIGDLTAMLLPEVCSQVATEPELQSVSQEDFSLSTANAQNGVRLETVMNGF